MIQQCTTATLNLTATGSGSAGLGASACEAVDPGITAAYSACCVGAGSVCDSGRTPADINATSCVEILDAFNNALTFAAFPSSYVSAGAKSQNSQCKIANGDGLVNAGRILGPAK